MRGQTKLLSVAAVFAVIVFSSTVFASGLVSVSKLSLFGTPVYPDAPDAVVFVDPSQIIKDYVKDPGYQIGDLLQVSVNVTTAADLFSYQVNVTWSPSVLNFTRIVSYGDFLSRTGSSYGTSKIEPTWAASNDTGYASIAETILGDVAGISGGGRLFTIEFEIVGYGATDITIGQSSTLPTTLLSSTGETSAYTVTNGYFSNKLIGDVDSDQDVDGVDFGIFAPSYGSTIGLPEYRQSCDLDLDGDVDGVDFGIFAPNYGRTYP